MSASIFNRERPFSGTSSLRPTRRRSTLRGTGIPSSWPRVLIHMHRALCMWPAIIRIVRRGAPGTAVAHSPGGMRSTRKTVTRLLVRQVLRMVSRRSGITSARPFTEEVLSLHDATGVFSNSMFLSHTVPAPSTAKFSLMRSGFWPLFK